MTTNLLSDGLRANQASIMLRGLIWPLDQYANQVAELMRDYPELEPELIAANEHVKEAGLAIQRAHEFIVTRFDVEHPS